MKAKTNKKGFTLIELLAVIVVLALIMILAVPSILSAANKSKQKLFQEYGSRLVLAAMSEYEVEKSLGDYTGTKYNGNPCYTIAGLGISSSGSYKGFIEVIPSSLIGEDGKNATQYKVYLTDGTYAYNGDEATTVQNNANAIKTDKTSIDTVSGIIEDENTCK